MTNAADRSWIKLKKALKKNDVAFVLGAGVSVQSGVPLWPVLVERLVDAAGLAPARKAALLRLRNDENMPDQTVLSLLKQEWSPPGGTSWTETVRRALYDPVRERIGQPHFDELGQCEYDQRADADLAARLAKGNSTLAAIVDLCAKKVKGTWIPRRHVRAVLTFNFDGLVQIYDRCRHGSPRIFRTIERASTRFYNNRKAKERGKIPLYQLHGYLLPSEDWYGGDTTDVVLTEEEYHERTDGPFNFANTTLLSHLQRGTCIFVGCSMTDELMRRALYRSRSELKLALGERPGAKPIDPGKLPRHFAVLPRTGTGERLDERERWFRESLRILGVEAVWVRADFRDLPTRLASLELLLS